MKLEFLAAGSPDCPLIRLFDFDQAEAQNLRELAGSLANGSSESVAVNDEPWIVSIRDCRLTFRLGTGYQGVRQSGPSTFDCVLSATNWSNVEGLLHPFCESDDAGFQWLSREGRISLLFSTDGHW